MDPRRFDAWSKRFATTTDRRQVLAGLGAALLGALGLRPAAAECDPEAQRICREDCEAGCERRCHQDRGNCHQECANKQSACERRCPRAGRARATCLTRCRRVRHACERSCRPKHRRCTGDCRRRRSGCIRRCLTCTPSPCVPDDAAACGSRQCGSVTNQCGQVIPCGSGCGPDTQCNAAGQCEALPVCPAERVCPGAIDGCCPELTPHCCGLPSDVFCSATVC